MSDNLPQNPKPVVYIAQPKSRKKLVYLLLGLLFLLIVLSLLFLGFILIPNRYGKFWGQKSSPLPSASPVSPQIASINSIISQVKNPDFASLGITEAPQKEGGQIVYVKKGPNEEIIYKTRSGNVEGNMLKLLNGMPEDKEFRIPKIPGYLEIREDLQAGRTAEAKAKLIILLQNSLVSNSLSIEPPTGDRLTLFPTAEDVKKVDPNGEYGLKRFTRISEVRKPVFDATLKLLGGL